MPTLKSTIDTVPARNLKHKTYVSRPSFTQGELPNIVAERMRRNKSLPKKFTVDKLTASLEAVYVPCWVSSVRSSCRWHGRYNDHRYDQVEKKIVCSKCNGDGVIFDGLAYMGRKRCPECRGTGSHGTKTEEKLTILSKRASGDTFIEISDFAVPDTRSYKIYLDLYRKGTPVYTLKPEQLAKMRVLSHRNTQPKFARVLLVKHASMLLEEDAQQKALLNNGAQIERLSKVRIEGKRPYLWLCPMYLGSVKHRLSKYHVQINAATGDVFIGKVPHPISTVPSKFAKYIIFPAIMGAVIFNILVAVF